MGLVEFTVWSIIFGTLFIVMVLYVAFGQITVRRLRKNPEVKEHLGISFVSGWDITNVASALCRPKWLDDRMKKNGWGFMGADIEVLYKHTTLFDRILGRLFWGLACFLTTFLLLVCVFD